VIFIVSRKYFSSEVNYYTDRLVTGDESKVALALGKWYGKHVHIVSASHDIEKLF